jgi:hypothetical protein
MQESLYVVEFDSGVVKVGRGRNPGQRIKSHEAIGRIAGWKKTREFTVLCTGSAGKPENELIAYASLRSKETRCREWFLGVNFDDLCTKADECAKIAQPKSVKREIAEFPPLSWFEPSKEQTYFSMCQEKAERLHDLVTDYGFCSFAEGESLGFNDK